MTTTVTTELREELDWARIDYDLIEHRRTQTAGEEARALGVQPDEVAKTLVLVSDERFVRAVIAASDRLDLHRVREVLGDNHARLATEAELVLAYPMYELGAVPPFGVPAGDRVLLDQRLADCASVVVEAGCHSASVRLKTCDLLELTHAEVHDLADAG